MRVDVEQRAKQARELFLSGYNCAQAVFITYRDVAAMGEEAAATVSAPFGGGMGRLREVCGAVSGMTMVAGFLSPNAQPNDNENKKKLYSMVQALAEEFRLENGSIVCRELLGLDVKKEEATPEKRTEEYYKKRPCVELVGSATEILEQYLTELLD